MATIDMATIEKREETDGDYPSLGRYDSCGRTQPRSGVYDAGYYGFERIEFGHFLTERRAA